MMRTRTLLPIATLLTLVLAACAVIILPPVDPFPNAIEVTPGANGTGNTALLSDTLAGGGSIVYEIDVSGITGDDVIYIEVDGDLDLKVYNASGTLLASSSSPDYFASGSGGLLLAPSTQGISVVVGCRGPCVIRETSSTTLYAELINNGAASRGYDFYAFYDDYGDTGDPGNDSSGGATTLNTSEQGAIETLGDVDYFDIGADGTLSLSVPAAGNPVDIEADVYDAGNNLIATLTDGDAVGVFDGESVRVRSDDSRAGASEVSRYTLNLAPGSPADASVSAGSPNVPVDNGAALAGSSVLFDVDFSGALGDDVVYLEVDETIGSGIDLFVYDANGNLLAESSSPDSFATAAVGPQGISVNVICRGPCVIRESGESTLFARLVNRNSSQNVSFDFFAFGDDFQDTGEPGNDSQLNLVAFFNSAEGAIETIGDVDFYRTASGGTITFDKNAGGNDDIDLQAEVIDGIDGVTVVAILQPGESYNSLLPDDFIRVTATNDTAGPAGASGYTLTVP